MRFELTAAEVHVGDCVRCGLCLETCPTYVLWGQEADSPRGRITQIAGALADGGQIPAQMAHHINTCLGDMACVSACPAGVAYDRVLGATRPVLEQQHGRSPGERILRRLLFETLPHPDRLRTLVPALTAAKRLGARRQLAPRLAAVARVAPDPPSRRELATPIPEFTAGRGPRRGEVALLLGCVQRVFHTPVHRATIGVLTAEGYDVHAPRLPDCCGSLEFQAGEHDAAAARAQATLDAFGALGDLDRLSAVITSAAGCGATMKDYGTLLDTDAAWSFAGRVRDIHEFLTEIEPRTPRGHLALEVVYQDACHLVHSQGVHSAPRGLLATIPGLQLLEVASEPELCCGAPGIYPATQPQASAALGRRKATAVIATGAEVIATANPGCAAQLARHCGDLGHPLRIHHPVELLWRSIQAA